MFHLSLFERCFLVGLLASFLLVYATWDRGVAIMHDTTPLEQRAALQHEYEHLLLICRKDSEWNDVGAAMFRSVEPSSESIRAFSSFLNTIKTDCRATYGVDV